MISIQNCHRVGEWWSGKRAEFENVSDPAGVYIPFNKGTVNGTLENLPIQKFF